MFYTIVFDYINIECNHFKQTRLPLFMVCILFPYPLRPLITKHLTVGLLFNFLDPSTKFRPSSLQLHIYIPGPKQLLLSYSKCLVQKALNYHNCINCNTHIAQAKVIGFKCNKYLSTFLLFVKSDFTFQFFSFLWLA